MAKGNAWHGAAECFYYTLEAISMNAARTSANMKTEIADDMASFQFMCSPRRYVYW